MSEGKIFKFIGCGCVLVMILSLGGCVTLTFGLFYLIKTTEPYQYGLEQAQQHPEVIQILGEPITDGWWISGNIETNNSSGTADISIPLGGPRGNGTLFVIGDKEAGKWTYSRIRFQADSGEEVELIPLLDHEINDTEENSSNDPSPQGELDRFPADQF